MPDDLQPERPAESSTNGEPASRTAERPLFLHPRWTVGVVLIFGVAAIVAGLGNPVWFLIGAPCILVLVIYVWVRLWHGGRP
jgi:hypothetical protein